jgi:deazaflavin-dependent oxidoreductase (nitroreductase family)
LIASAAAAAASAGVVWWREHPRFGSVFVNQTVDPWLVRNGIVDKSRGEIALLEHVGRRSGIVRMTPVHPVATDEGFRIIVPLGNESQWAQNVIAAGRCRIQVGDVIHEAGEPTLVAPSAVVDLPPFTARPMTWLGFRYLVLRRLSTGPGTLEASRAA